MTLCYINKDQDNNDEYNHDILEKAIIKFKGNYRLSYIICHCNDFQYYHLLSVLYYIHHMYSDSIESQILYYQYNVHNLKDILSLLTYYDEETISSLFHDKNKFKEILLMLFI